MGFYQSLRTFSLCAVGVTMAIVASLACLFVWLIVRPFTDKFIAQRALDWIAATYWRFLVYWVEVKYDVRAQLGGTWLASWWACVDAWMCGALVGTVSRCGSTARSSLRTRMPS